MTLNPTEYIRLLGAGGEGLGLDEAFNVLAAIDVPHREVHEGHSFVTNTVDTDMDAAATLILAFKTPNTPAWGHMIASFGAKATGHMDIIEGPAWTNQTGSQNPIYNRDRNSALKSAILEDQSSAAFTATENVILNPTGLTGGTIIQSIYSWSDKKTTTKDRDQAEIILAQDTQYAVRYTSDGATNAGELILNWYEHANE